MVGGLVEATVGRVLDMLLALSSLIVALALVGVFWPSYVSLLLAVSVAAVPWYAHIYRSLVLKDRYKHYLDAARATGAGWQRIAWPGTMPNIAGPALFVTTLNPGRIVLNLWAHIFLGLRAQSPAAEWGARVNEARSFFQAHPGLILAPGIAIILTVVCVNLIANVLRDLMDPRRAARARGRAANNGD